MIALAGCLECGERLRHVRLPQEPYFPTESMPNYAALDPLTTVRIAQMLRQKKPSSSVSTLATIGDGVELRCSGIPNAGLGLFATRAFRKNQWITVYEGNVVRRTEPHGNVFTHWYTLLWGDQILDGLRSDMCPEYLDPNDYFQGLGGGSFSNSSADDPKAKNATDGRIAGAGSVDLVVLRATRDIAVGEEILWDYDFRFRQPPAPEAIESEDSEVPASDKPRQNLRRSGPLATM